ncbi:GNAT family N-acetyltransferase [Massilia sp. CT11-108]|uniref:GNAT family N-acetyltransferase n=1 Tax=Massilia sp. CT11-108 TaxID=3393900 RepID=UPI0039A464A6
MARHGLLLSYVIRCGENDVAVVYGMRSASVWHVYKILCRQDYMHLSVGTSAIHLAVQDVLAHFTFDHIDFGYGTPHAEFRSTHVLETRGLVLLHRARSGTAWLLNVHGRYDALNGALIRQVKRFRK